MVNKWVITCYNPLINRVYWGYNPLTNLLLRSWDIQVGNEKQGHVLSPSNNTVDGRNPANHLGCIKPCK